MLTQTPQAATEHACSNPETYAEDIRRLRDAVLPTVDEEPKGDTREYVSWDELPEHPTEGVEDILRMPDSQRVRHALNLWLQSVYFQMAAQLCVHDLSGHEIFEQMDVDAGVHGALSAVLDEIAQSRSARTLDTWVYCHIQDEEDRGRGGGLRAEVVKACIAVLVDKYGSEPAPIMKQTPAPKPVEVAPKPVIVERPAVTTRPTVAAPAVVQREVRSVPRAADAGSAEAERLRDEIYRLQCEQAVIADKYLFLRDKVFARLEKALGEFQTNMDHATGDTEQDVAFRKENLDWILNAVTHISNRRHTPPSVERVPDHVPVVELRRGLELIRRGGDVEWHKQVIAWNEAKLPEIVEAVSTLRDDMLALEGRGLLGGSKSRKRGMRLLAFGLSTQQEVINAFDGRHIQECMPTA
ncbi:hypothetical protein HOH67_02765 [Candidatus Peregrinibacteria bacterium]|nr:hypothetical protein [Candidatus Peregrinibacteria bacterium]